MTDAASFAAVNRAQSRPWELEIASVFLDSLHSGCHVSVVQDVSWAVQQDPSSGKARVTAADDDNLLSVLSF